MKSLAFEEVAHKTILDVALLVIQTLKRGIMCRDVKMWLPRSIWFPLYWRAPFWHSKIIKASCLRCGMFLYYPCKSLSPCLYVTQLIPKDCATTLRDECPMEKGLWEGPASCKINSATPVCHFALLLRGKKIPKTNKKPHASDFFWLKLGIQKAVFINESY